MFLGTLGFLFLVVFIMSLMDPIADKIQSNKQDKETDDTLRELDKAHLDAKTTIFLKREKPEQK